MATLLFLGVAITMITIDPSTLDSSDFYSSNGLVHVDIRPHISFDGDDDEHLDVELRAVVTSDHDEEEITVGVLRAHVLLGACDYRASLDVLIDAADGMTESAYNAVCSLADKDDSRKPNPAFIEDIELYQDNGFDDEKILYFSGLSIINHLFVEPGFRREGIGKRLIEKFQMMTAKNTELMVLKAYPLELNIDGHQIFNFSPSDVAAVRLFYRKMGFQVPNLDEGEAHLVGVTDDIGYDSYTEEYSDAEEDAFEIVLKVARHDSEQDFNGKSNTSTPELKRMVEQRMNIVAEGKDPMSYQELKGDADAVSIAVLQQHKDLFIEAPRRRAVPLTGIC